MKKTPATEKEIYLSFTLLSHTQFYLHKSDYFVQNLTLFYYGFIYKVPVRGLKKNVRPYLSQKSEFVL